MCSGNRVCGRCGEEKFNKDCKARQIKAKCVHCGGEDHAGSAQCPKREKEVKVSRIRAESGTRPISYAEDVRRVEREEIKSSERVCLQREFERKGEMSEQNICMDKKRYYSNGYKLCSGYSNQVGEDKVLEAAER